MREPEVDAILEEEEFRDLVGYEFRDESMDTVGYTIEMAKEFHAHLAMNHTAMYKNIPPECLQKYLGFRPLDIVKKTLENTMQMAKMIARFPM